jgi:4-hydroxy-2-oxoheptanedioate aldolase
MMRPFNRVREQLDQNNTVYGFLCRTLSAGVVELVGLCGFDFVWIDMEHSAAEFGVVENLCRAADAVDLEALVRVPDGNPANVLRALEAGAGIVNVPQVETAEQASAIVRAARYFPQGQRGFSSASRGTRYGTGSSLAETIQLANQRVMVMVQIESLQGAQNADAICAVPGVDIVLIGLGDLSQSMGLTGQLAHPRVLEAAESSLESILRANKTAAMYLEGSADTKRWAAAGVRVFCCGTDLSALRTRLSSLRQELRGPA